MLNRQIIALGINHASNALFPLLAFPVFYLNVESSTYTNVVLVEAVSIYLTIIVLYSFDVSGVNELKINKNVTNAFLEILYTRLLIFICAASIILTVVYIAFSEHTALAIIWLLYPLGMILQNNYYYLALKKNTVIAKIVITSRILGISFVLFSDNLNELNFSIFISGSYLFSGVISTVYIFRQINNKYTGHLFLKQIKDRIKSGLPIFIGNASIIFIRSSNIFLLAIMSSIEIIAVYSIVEKIIKSIQSTMRPFAEFIQSELKNSDAMVNQKIESIYLKSRYLGALGLVIIFISGLLVHINIKYNLYDTNEMMNTMFLVMLLAIPFGNMNYIVGPVGLNILGLDDIYTKISLKVAVVSIIATTFLIFIFSPYGASIGYVCGELFFFYSVVRHMRGIR